MAWKVSLCRVLKCYLIVLSMKIPETILEDQLKTLQLLSFPVAPHDSWLLLRVVVEILQMWHSFYLLLKRL